MTSNFIGWLFVAFMAAQGVAALVAPQKMEAWRRSLVNRSSMRTMLEAGPKMSPRLVGLWCLVMAALVSILLVVGS